MASLNKVFLMGRLGKDPELRYTQNQIAVCTLNMATEEISYNDSQKRSKTEWHTVIAWRGLGESVAKHLKKGSPIFVEGRKETRFWEDKDGNKRSVVEIIASNIQFLPTDDRQNDATSNPELSQDPPLYTDSDVPPEE